MYIYLFIQMMEENKLLRNEIKSMQEKFGNMLKSVSLFIYLLLVNYLFNYLFAQVTENRNEINILKAKIGELNQSVSIFIYSFIFG